MQFTFNLDPDPVIQALDDLESAVQEESGANRPAAPRLGEKDLKGHKLLLGAKELAGTARAGRKKRNA
jgi:hypothetical protein